MVAQREIFYYGAQEERMDFSEERARSPALASVTEKVSTAGGTMYVTVSVDERRRPIEVFIRIGRMGETEHAHLTGLGRALSYALRTGANPLGLIDSLAGITSEPVWDKGELILSAEDGVAKVLRRVVEGHYDDMFGDMFRESQTTVSDARTAVEPVPIRPASGYVGDKCHQCRGRAIFQEGCLGCLDCGYSKCE